MSDALVFPLTEVKENGSMAVSVSVPSEPFADALSEGVLLGAVAVAGRILAVEDNAMFEGTASGRWKFECTRCLTPVEAEWTEPVTQTSPLDKGPMDLNEEVRQSIGLAEPMKMVCKPDCKGLCAVCRVNRNLKDCGHPQPEGGSTSTRPRLTPRHQKG